MSLMQKCQLNYVNELSKIQGIHKAVGLTAMILDCIPKINNVYYNIYNNILLIAILY